MGFPQGPARCGLGAGSGTGLRSHHGRRVSTGTDRPEVEYTYDGEYRMSQDLNEPAVPARAAEVVKFISDLGYLPRPYGGNTWTWRWKRNKSKPDTFDFFAGQFRASSASAQQVAHGLVVSISAGIVDSGYEVGTAGSMATVDGSAFPGRSGFLQSDSSGRRLPEHSSRFQARAGSGWAIRSRDRGES